MNQRFNLLIAGIFISACLLQTNLQAQTNNSVSFKDGDVVCFIGNSITHGGVYHAFLQLYTATRFPNEKVNYINCGVAGGVAHEMLRRLHSDILIHKPDYAFVMVGMNDVLRELYSLEKVDTATLQKRTDALNKYYASSEELVVKLLENNVRPILMTPSIYDQTAKLESKNRFGVNDALGLCAKHIERLSVKYNTPLVDLYSIMNELNNEGQAGDSTYSLIGQDRVHPGQEGHFVMANEIIKTLFPSKYISRIEIDAKKRQVQSSQNCNITVLSTKGSIRFVVLENALPFPLNSNIKTMAEKIDFNNQLNRQELTVRNLKKGDYQLAIDSVIIDTFSAQDLSAGVNLALYEQCPQYVQAKKIEELCFQYLSIQHEIRAITLIRYKMLFDYTGSEDYAEKRAFLDDKLSKIKGKEHLDWLTNGCLQYFENLPKEDAFWDELQAVRDKIYELNEPQVHQYILSPL